MDRAPVANRLDGRRGDGHARARHELGATGPLTGGLPAEVAELRAEVAELRAAVDELRSSLGG